MNNKRPNILIFAALTTTTIFTWTAFEVYRTLNKTSLESVPQDILAPLSPTLDQEALKLVKDRRFFEDSEISSLGKPKTAAEENEATSGAQAQSNQ
ncbi:MAG: hypothetical protein HYU80_00970 [Candidatus Blackburnbacteria bacterium]|nr:hypothetical protein [Candidatus Blackburnbacteria bacterium]